jgi:hypothetical protein
MEHRLRVLLGCCLREAWRQESDRALLDDFQLGSDDDLNATEAMKDGDGQL